MTSKPLPPLIDPPFPGFIFVGQGPLDMTAYHALDRGLSEGLDWAALIDQVCLYDIARWKRQGNGNSPRDYYAILEGSVMAKLNGLHTEIPAPDYDF